MSVQIDSDSPQPTDDLRPEIHEGHAPEQGFAVRAREWIDLFPCLRMIRVLRLAGSPPMVMLTAAVFLIWWLGLTVFGRIPEVEGADRVAAWTWQSAIEPIGRATSTLRQPATADSDPASWSSMAAWWGWTLLLWTPWALITSRQGAVLTAGRPMVMLPALLGLAIRRAPQGWAATVAPLACAIPFALMMLVIAWIESWFGDHWLPIGVGSILLALIALPSGILIAGAVFAVPIGWAAIANERDPNFLDSLSRGYEYLFRRPAHLAVYATIGVVLTLLVGSLAALIGWTATGVATSMISAAGGSVLARQTVAQLLQPFPLVVCLTLIWGLIGSIYLLLRYDADGQEVEDLWIPMPDVEPPVPELVRK